MCNFDKNLSKDKIINFLTSNHLNKMFNINLFLKTMPFELDD